MSVSVRWVGDSGISSYRDLRGGLVRRVLGVESLVERSTG